MSVDSAMTSMTWRQKVGDMVGDFVGADFFGAVGDDVGDFVGDSVGDIVGDTVGAGGVGDIVGDGVKESSGGAESSVGEDVGLATGEEVGDAVGLLVGDDVGLPDGDDVGLPVGDKVGPPVGADVGAPVGDEVEGWEGDCAGASGALVGAIVGAIVGLWDWAIAGVGATMLLTIGSSSDTLPVSPSLSQIWRREILASKALCGPSSSPALDSCTSARRTISSSAGSPVSAAMAVVKPATVVSPSACRHTLVAAAFSSCTRSEFSSNSRQSPSKSLTMMLARRAFGCIQAHLIEALFRSFRRIVSEPSRR